MSYRVEHIETGQGPQYVVVDGSGRLALPPCKYLKHLRVVGRSTYTQKAYAYGLKEYSVYLERLGLAYEDASMPVLMKFVQWLQDPTVGTNIVRVGQSTATRQPKTVNLYVTAVTSFYKYLYESGAYDADLSEKYLEAIQAKPKYKDFLYHIHSGESVRINKLHVKERRTKLRVLDIGQVESVINATTNVRDRFLVYLLFVSGLRIGEALSLFNTDIVFDLKNGHRIDLHDRGELPNGGHLKTGERTVFIDQKCMDMLDDYQYEMLGLVDKDSDYVFVKIAGANAGQPMTYQDVAAVFRRLRAKTGIDVHPHLLRHTHATRYYEETKDVKSLQERLGHSDIQTTVNMYVHASDSMLRDDWENAIGAFLIGEGT